MKKLLTALCLTTLLSPAAFAEQWLTTLETATPQEGYELAIKLSRMAVKFTQPSAEKRTAVRAEYETDADNLIAAAQTVATNYQTVAAANNYWKK
ncbi:MAG: peroxidase [Gammaproteobacteria bacterium]|nr:peroxidase [Gammaproteobacteria bacterium]